MIKLNKAGTTIPGEVFVNPLKIDCIQPWEANQTGVFLGEYHFIVEGTPDQIARLINQWFKDHLQTQTHMMRGTM